MSSTTFRRIVFTAGYSAVFLQVLLVALRPAHYLWDFRAYYFGAKLALSGDDPYNLERLSAAMLSAGIDDGNVVPFIYPGHTLLLFAPLTAMPFVAAFYAYLAVKVSALTVVLVVGAKWLDGWWRVWWPLLASAMFGGAMGGDLRSGNIGMIEAALVMVSVAVLCRRRVVMFGLLSALASSWKLVLAPLILLAFASKATSPLKGVIPGVTAIAALLAADRFVRPDLWAKFQASSSELLQDFEEGSLRGTLNSSLLRLLADVSVLTAGRVDSAVVLSAYAGLALLVVTVTILTLIRSTNQSTLPMCMYALLAFGVVVPRLAPYSLVLLVLPVVYVLNKNMPTRLAAAVAAFACIPFFYIGRAMGRPDDAAVTSFFMLPVEYANLLTIATCWVVMTCCLRRAKPDAVAPEQADESNRNLRPKLAGKRHTDKRPAG